MNHVRMFPIPNWLIRGTVQPSNRIEQIFGHRRKQLNSDYSRWTVAPMQILCSEIPPEHNNRAHAQQRGLSSNWTENRVKRTHAAHRDSSGAMRSPFLSVPIPHLTSFNDSLPVFAQYNVRRRVLRRVVARTTWPAVFISVTTTARRS